ncbi:conserved exported protein of unknown function [Streptomyces ambofaciens ATCC 23877]|uniref:Uncharacterized protein SAMT0022 n=1 Tax=Streptomyces ambofaciens (strain ATCC 23877 / 3486 / DSM 40053 / JCM 4204 / NBRC 12836 / NRRL B-2516) TaxID=278992 RepID=Q1RR63_STRA7|nr:hypothetical protein [Streptomyces ambofaciens]AKZ60681.1 conserved exported protein of unknown function [Streptomyces ambofaciens ATCC 23877]CAI77951.1 unknown hypothetical protein [Streptomyces ambofaciens ATCC 23877]CAI78225.1 unknown hypothetical protein [Streptomyces ambofaciens ATCC 23877]CAJ87732.1 hypothetical protein SAMT0023 [Streptomyces ambofaciens ATCC 23877]CAJ89010.1 hypothetical protein SAMT0023 [Streptomyces ambofaciens ATCC 23877]
MPAHPDVIVVRRRPWGVAGSLFAAVSACGAVDAVLARYIKDGTVADADHGDSPRTSV